MSDLHVPLQFFVPVAQSQALACWSAPAGMITVPVTAKREVVVDTQLVVVFRAWA
jgi:hypothetical protein